MNSSSESSLVRLLLGRRVGRGRRGRVDHVDGGLVDRLVDEHGQVVVRQRDVLHRRRRPVLAAVAVALTLKWKFIKSSVLYRVVLV